MRPRRRRRRRSRRSATKLPAGGRKLSKDAAQPYDNVLERLWIFDPVPAWQPARDVPPVAPLGRPPSVSWLTRRLLPPCLGPASPALCSRTRSSARHRARRDAPRRPLRVARHALRPRLCSRTRRPRSTTCGPSPAIAGGRPIVERSDKRVLAIEVKLKRGPSRTKYLPHLRWLKRKRSVTNYSTPSSSPPARPPIAVPWDSVSCQPPYLARRHRKARQHHPPASCAGTPPTPGPARHCDALRHPTTLSMRTNLLSGQPHSAPQLTQRNFFLEHALPFPFQSPCLRRHRI